MSLTFLPSHSSSQSERVFRPFRYDFFVIWGNGLEHTEAILDLIRREPQLKILRLESRKIRNMKKFVFGLYACDSVPMGHLRAKLKYLFEARPEIFIVFVKNLAPLENFTGEGQFRHLQCAHIQRIKQGIRDLYNPRKNGGRTEEHVIHASDYEEQVDYFLRMLGYKGGLTFLDDGGAVLPFEKPYYIDRPRTYTFKTIPIAQLRAAVLTGSEKVCTEIRTIEETPHFQSLHGDAGPYQNYLSRYKYTYLHEDYSAERFVELSRMPIRDIEDLGPVIVGSMPPHYRIFDGVHRASIALYHGCDSIRCVEVA